MLHNTLETTTIGETVQGKWVGRITDPKTKRSEKASLKDALFYNKLRSADKRDRKIKQR
jgi:hypothetical protein